MSNKKIMDKLESDLSHFLIDEIVKSNPDKRGTSDIYKYKGLSLTIDTESRKKEKTIKVRIGPLEAEFVINDCTKSTGALAPIEEKLVMIWMGMSENSKNLSLLFKNAEEDDRRPRLIPFDMEDYFNLKEK